MHRKLVVAMFAAFAVPSSAFAIAPQHPADSARSHPASSAHANALAAQANAARLETCDGLSSAMLGALQEADFNAATAHFDAGMLANLDAKKLAALWASVSTRFGALRSRGSPQAAMYQELFIVATPLYFANGGVKAQVVCDMDNKIVGFHIQLLTPAPSR